MVTDANASDLQEVRGLNLRNDKEKAEINKIYCSGHEVTLCLCILTDMAVHSYLSLCKLPLSVSSIFSIYG